MIDERHLESCVILGITQHIKMVNNEPIPVKEEKKPTNPFASLSISRIVKFIDLCDSEEKIMQIMSYLTPEQVRELESINEHVTEQVDLEEAEKEGFFEEYTESDSKEDDVEASNRFSISPSNLSDTLVSTVPSEGIASDVDDSGFEDEDSEDYTESDDADIKDIATDTSDTQTDIVNIAEDTDEDGFESDEDDILDDEDEESSDTDVNDSAEDALNSASTSSVNSQCGKSDSNMTSSVASSQGISSDLVTQSSISSIAISDAVDSGTPDEDTGFDTEDDDDSGFEDSEDEDSDDSGFEDSEDEDSDDSGFEDSEDEDSDDEDIIEATSDAQELNRVSVQSRVSTTDTDFNSSDTDDFESDDDSGFEDSEDDIEDEELEFNDNTDGFDDSEDDTEDEIAISNTISQPAVKQSAQSKLGTTPVPRHSVPAVNTNLQTVQPRTMRVIPVVDVATSTPSNCTIQPSAAHVCTQSSSISARNTSAASKPAVGTTPREYDIARENGKSVSSDGELYEDGWSITKYLKANKGNKAACRKEVVLKYYSAEIINRGEDAGKFIISKGILRI